jgi:hypothetical protein
MNIPIELLNCDGQIITINNKTTKSCHKLLGYLQSMACPIEHQVQNLNLKIKEYRNCLSTSELDYKETRIFYQTIFAPKIQYITQLSSIKHNKIESQFKQCNLLTLRRMGYSGSTTKDIYFGHKSFAGLE